MIKVQWRDNKKTILTIKFMEDWTLHDVKVIGQDIGLILGDVSHTVHIVLDFSHTNWVPPHIIQLIDATIRRLPQGIGLIVINQADDYLKGIIQWVRSMYPQARSQVYVVNTITDAHLIIERLGFFFDN